MTNLVDTNKNMILMMISNQIAKYFNNDMYSPIIYMLISSLNLDLAINDSYLSNIMLIIMMIIMLGCGYGLYILFLFWDKKRYSELKLISSADQQYFTKYIEINNYVSKNNNLVKGNVHDILENKIDGKHICRLDVRSDDNVKIYFKDIICLDLKSIFF